MWAHAVFSQVFIPYPRNGASHVNDYKGAHYVQHKALQLVQCYHKLCLIPGSQTVVPIVVKILIMARNASWEAWYWFIRRCASRVCFVLHVPISHASSYRWCAAECVWYIAYMLPWEQSISLRVPKLSDCVCARRRCYSLAIAFYVWFLRSVFAHVCEELLSSYVHSFRITEQLAWDLCVQNFQEQKKNHSSNQRRQTSSCPWQVLWG